MIADLGTYGAGAEPPESALGIYYRLGAGWFVKCWRESYGPFNNRQLAEENLKRIAGNNPVLLEAWVYKLRNLANGMLCGASFLAACLGMYSIGWMLMRVWNWILR